MRFSVQACGDGFAFSLLVMIKRQVFFGVVLVISRLISQEIIYFSTQIYSGWRTRMLVETRDTRD